VVNIFVDICASISSPIIALKTFFKPAPTVYKDIIAKDKAIVLETKTSIKLASSLLISSIAFFTIEALNAIEDSPLIAPGIMPTTECEAAKVSCVNVLTFFKACSLCFVSYISFKDKETCFSEAPTIEFKTETIFLSVPSNCKVSLTTCFISLAY